MCVNLIATGDLKNICTENVTGTDTFEKIECGYGIRTRLSIPESAKHPIKTVNTVTILDFCQTDN